LRLKNAENLLRRRAAACEVRAVAHLHGPREASLPKGPRSARSVSAIRGCERVLVTCVTKGDFWGNSVGCGKCALLLRFWPLRRQGRG
jgi:hypothetical protein